MKKPPVLPPSAVPDGFWPLTLQTTLVLAGKGGLGVQVRTVLLTLQAGVVFRGVNVAGEMNWADVFAVSIGSLKVKTTAAEGETPLAKFAGSVDRMVGCALTKARVNSRNNEENTEATG
jgi:hypothetical protein